jgi:hypothetical protein
VPRIELISRDESFEIGDADHSYTIRRMHPDIEKEIRRRNTRWIEPNVGGEMRRQELDEIEWQKDRLDYILQAWYGILGVEGKEAACTRENKWLLPVSEKMQVLVAAGALDTRGTLGTDLKNLSASCGTAVPDGRSTPAT